MINVMILFVILALVALACGSVIRAKKKGQTCIGCPNAGNCGGK